MNYLVSKFTCFCQKPIFENAKYTLTDVKDEYTALYFSNTPIYINFFNIINGGKQKNVVKVNYLNDCYIFLFCAPFVDFQVHEISALNVKFFITISNRLTISVDGEILAELENVNLTYSHYETKKDFIYIYFSGERPAVAIFKKNALVYCDYYDELNKGEEEVYFLTRLYDTLNHGRVCKINSEAETYLVYLDDYELNLKPEFTAFVFLDCVIAGNLKYANNLLKKEMREQDEKNIAKFFGEFNYYYPLEQNVFALFKKDALQGIFKFEMENDTISNIIEV